MSRDKAWNQMTLGDFVAMRRGHDLTSSERNDGDVPVFGAAGQNGTHDTAIAKGPGIVVGRSGGSFGQVHYSHHDFWPHNTALYVNDLKGNDLRFTYFLLKSINFESYNSGSAQPSLNRNFIYPIPICVPNVQDQKIISNFLTNLDAKISLNNRINTELEGMAKMLYDYWFVQFEFPITAEQAAAMGKPHLEGHPYKASGAPMTHNKSLKRDIPVGWEVKGLKELAPVLTGKEDANHSTENGEYPFFTCGDTTLRCDDFKFKGKAILLAGNGNFGLKFYEGSFNAYQRTYVLIPHSDDHFSTIWFAVKDSIRALTQGSSGSIIKFLRKGDIENILIPMPSSCSEIDFEAINRMLLTILNNQKQNQHLTTLRDFLLPMLMNGQVTVK